MYIYMYCINLVLKTSKYKINTKHKLVSFLKTKTNLKF